jgi:thioredoxin 1
METPVRLDPQGKNRCSRRLALAMGLALAACGGGGSPTTTSAPSSTSRSGPSAVVILSAANFDAVVASAGVCLVDFYHPSCSHCRAMEPVVEELARNFQGQAVVGKVDVTADPALAGGWKVRGYPTFIVLKGGQEHSSWLGETTYARLAGMIRAALGS